MAFPAIGEAVRSGKVTAGTFVEPFYSAEMAKGGLRKLFTATEAMGYDHELLDIFFGEKFLKQHPDAVRAFLADYVAVTSGTSPTPSRPRPTCTRRASSALPRSRLSQDRRLEA